MVKNLGIKLRKASPKRGEDSEHESPKQITIPEFTDFLNDNLDQHPNDTKIGSPSHHDNTNLANFQEDTKVVGKHHSRCSR